MSVSQETFEKVSRIARLKFSVSEMEECIRDMKSVISYVKKIDELNTDAFDILISPLEEENRWREDKAEKSISQKEVLKNAPQSLGGYIFVPNNGE